MTSDQLNGSKKQNGSILPEPKRKSTMTDTAHRAVAIVGVGAVLPDAPDAPTFWNNLTSGRYSITDVRPERWDPDLYFDPDPKAPDKSYSKIGGWCHDWNWEPMKWRLPIPPKVADQMDRTQKWAIIAAREALNDYGYPDRALDSDRTAVIVGNAMGGDKHYITALRIFFPEYAQELEHAPSFAALPEEVQQTILKEMQAGIGKRIPEITEDTMPGELANIIAGRIANLFNFHGPNYIVDAACASAMAGITAAIEGLTEHDYDAVITGGTDANMSASTFTKFCKIGALSATGTRPYGKGADGFVMGEGSAMFLLKRLADAEKDGDKIYAVIRGMGGSSDGRGKGITAPNPIGQKFAIQRGWENAGLVPDAATLIEGHGTSTRVGDVIEADSLAEVFKDYGLPVGSIPLGSVKSNIGHLKGAAGAAGMLKAALALHHKTLPPSLNAETKNPNINFAESPLRVNTELRPWEKKDDQVRSAGVSAFGFGGTNFHGVMEEYVPGRLKTNGRTAVSFAGAQPGGSAPASVSASGPSAPASATPKTPLRGALVIGGASYDEIKERLTQVKQEADQGRAPEPAPPAEKDLRAPVRLAIDYADAAELAGKAERALKAIDANHPGMWKALRAQGIFRGEGPALKVAFLYTGQGSQYANMLSNLRKMEPIVAKTFKEADEVMTPILGKPLSDYIFIDADDPAAVKKLEADLRQTEITQPAVLATDDALTRMMAAYGIVPDMVMGHSLGEYGALVASGALPFDDALRAVSARAHAMTEVSLEDNGLMAAVFAPIEEVERLLETVEGYVVIANINSTAQSVIGGSTAGVKEAGKVIMEAGYDVRPIPVSHAFHTSIVAPASEPLKKYLKDLNLQPPTRPIIANVSGEFYPMHPGVVPEIIDILGKQVASPVQFVKGLKTLYDAGVRVFVETGPKKALWGFAEDVLGSDPEVSALFANHPKQGDVMTFNHALCGLYAAGHGVGVGETVVPTASVETLHVTSLQTSQPEPALVPAPVVAQAPAAPRPPVHAAAGQDKYVELGKLFADFLDRGRQIYEGRPTPAPAGLQEPIVVTGASLGLPGRDKVFDDTNVEALLHGDQFIDVIPTKLRRDMVNKHITRLVKPKNGEPHFEIIENQAEVIKLAGRAGELDIVGDFGYPANRDDALESTDRLCIGAGVDALRDAGVPLAMHYKVTTTNSKLPERWMLPPALRDETGVIFASAFPGYDAFAEEMKNFYTDQALRQRLEDLRSLRERLTGTNGDDTLAREIDRRIHELEAGLTREEYHLDRKWMFRILSMGHSQFAEYIGARGPNTQINAACASTTQAVALAEDWIRTGRCRRVVIVAADNVTSDNLLHWIGAGFLASGAAATDEVVEEAALPFDRRRHGMIVGMGAASIVVESADAARERGVRPITEVLSTVTRNSAFHGTRLDISHIRHVMEDLIVKAEQQWGINRYDIAPQTVFVSHETYTPARGGSAQAEIDALRHVFGAAADQVVIANTKGYTGHAMGAGVEDVLAIKALETGLVPPVANFKEIDPDLGNLNLSKGGAYPVQYALRLGAGFGSQISLSLMRWVPSPNGARPDPDGLGFAYRVENEGARQDWLARVSGYASPELEIVKRTLRFKDQGVPDFDTVPERVARPAPAPAPPPVVPKQPAAPVAATPAAPAPVPKAPEPAPVAVTPAPVPAAPAVDPIEKKVLALVAEQTGYPEDMLDLDLDLEADLGIDTVKQAELFAAVREEYGIERDENLQLRDFPTLAHTIQFVYDKRPDLKQAAPAPAPTVSGNGAMAPAAAPAAPVATAEDPIKQKVLALVAEQTGYPEDMLDLDLDLEADLGIDTVKQAELFAAVREEYGIERDENLQLRDFPTLAHTIQFVYDKRPDLKTAAPAPAPAATPVAASAPAAAPAPAPAPVAAPAVATEDPVKEKVLELIAGQTGYPVDMLELDLDLEADLGIDTVKQAELFAAVREEYGIERDENLQLRDFPTLAHTIQFVYDKRPDLAPTAAPAAAPAQAPAAVAAPETPVAAPTGNGAPAAAPVEVDEPVKIKVLDLIAEQTGYPVEMLELDLDLEADLGIDTVKQAELFAAVREEYGIERDENLQLRDFPTLAHTIQFVYDKRPDLKPSAAPVAAAPAAVPEAPAAAPEAPAATPAEAGEDPVTAKVLELVAEQTGYPEDMLGLDLDLEADLGIDTVKQAEMFANIRAAYDIERDDNLQLRDYPTLSHVIQFVHDRAPSLASGVADHAGDGVAAPEAPVMAPRIVGTLEDAATIARRVPVPVLRPALDLCKPTGVTLDENSYVVVMKDQGGVGKALVNRLEKRKVNVLAIDDAPDAEALIARIDEWRGEAPVTGVYWLPALDDEGSLFEMDLDGWREALRVRVKLLYATMRALYEQVNTAETFLVSATRLGGQHGYDEAGAVAPMGGPVVGFTKTYKREHNDVLCKAVDFPPSRKTAALADLIIDETLRDPGVVEVGYKNDQRYAIGLEVQPIPENDGGLDLNKDTIFVVTGAAGSIVSAITQDLAEASSGTFYLLDLVPKPDPADPDIERFITDKDGLKRDIFERIKASGERATPAMVEKELAKLERAQAALAAIQAVEQAGGTAHYHSVNLLDAEGLTKVIDEIREQHGRIDVLLHAGGLEISRFLPQKERKEFDLVFDVKSDGWFSLLKAIGEMPLGAAVVFSSVAGRFGNAGQTDYSAANDLLCKTSSSFRAIRPETRGIAIDWTAWGGIGMATRGSIPKMMEAAGIGMLPPEAGIPIIRRELISGGWSGEFVAGKELGILVQEWDATGGLDLDALEAEPLGPISEQVTGLMLFDGLTIETTLDPNEQPFLFDHRIDGIPVLPGVMGVEAFGEAAKKLFPGWHVAAIEDVDFLAPFKFYRDEPRTVTVKAVLRHDGDELLADCRLIGVRELPRGTEATTHFKATVRLAEEAPKARKTKAPAAAKGSTVEQDDVYRVYFHGPAYQVLETVWRDGDTVVGLLPADLPANHSPDDLPLVMAPRLIESCFQTAGMWEMGTHGRMGLPMRIDEVRRFGDPAKAKGRLFAVVTPEGDRYDARVVDEKGAVFVTLKGYGTAELPGGVEAEALKPLQAAMS